MMMPSPLVKKEGSSKQPRTLPQDIMQKQARAKLKDLTGLGCVLGKHEWQSGSFMVGCTSKPLG